MKTGIEYYIINLPQATDDKIVLDDGTTLWLDTSFNPHEHRIPKGKVVATPKYDTPVQVGDYLYFHQNVVNNKKYHLGNNNYAVFANPANPMCYAYEREGKVNMLYDYMFIEGVEQSDSEWVNGIYIKKEKKTGDTIRDGYVRYASDESLASIGAELGDMVNFRRFRNAKYKVGEETLFRLRCGDINFIYEKAEEE